MTATRFPNALREMRKFSARVELPAPNTLEKNKDAASSLDFTSSALGTKLGIIIVESCLDMRLTCGKVCDVAKHI